MAIQKGAAGYSSRPLHSQTTMAKITILDACRVDGKAVSVGDVVDVTASVASQLISSNRAELASEKPAPKPTPAPAKKDKKE